MSPKTFTLYMLVSSADPSEPPRLLGAYGTYGAALVARDRHVLAGLAAVGGRRLELTHVILTRPVHGPWSTQRLVCSVGQPVGWPVDAPGELAETARWLAALRAQLG